VPEGPLPAGPVYAVEYGWPVVEEPTTRWLADELVLSVYLPEARMGRWTFEAGPWLFDRWLALELDHAATDAFGLVVGEGAPTQWGSSVYALRAGFQQARFAMSDTTQQCTRMADEEACRSAWIGTPRLRFGDEDQAQSAVFGDKMRLAWYAIEADGQGRIDVTLYWQALDGIRDDYTLFIHVLDADGALVTQWDGPPGGAAHLTSAWPQGAYRWQRATLELPEGGSPAGAYSLSVGLYTYPDLTRLPVVTDRPDAADGRLNLLDWIVEPSARE
jgi:hypothetical protein